MQQLTLVARYADDLVELEFLAAPEQENLEDRIAYLDEQRETPDERAKSHSDCCGATHPQCTTATITIWT